MLEFFKNIFKKLKYSINQEKYIQRYRDLINVFRRVTPLEYSDIDVIHTILKDLVKDTEDLDKKMNIFKKALLHKSDSTVISHKIEKPILQKEREVTYCVNGTIVYGDVGSDEEFQYFSKDNVQSLNSLPLKPKVCDFDCFKNECRFCLERRLRNEISKKMEFEQQNTKKRRISSKVVSELNEQLGLPKIFARYVADDQFRDEDLDEDERNEFINWKWEQKHKAELARKSLKLDNQQIQNVSFSRNTPLANNDPITETNQSVTSTNPFSTLKLPGNKTLVFELNNPNSNSTTNVQNPTNPLFTPSKANNSFAINTALDNSKLEHSNNPSAQTTDNPFSFKYPALQQIDSDKIKPKPFETEINSSKIQKPIEHKDPMISNEFVSSNKPAESSLETGRNINSEKLASENISFNPFVNKKTLDDQNKEVSLNIDTGILKKPFINVGSDSNCDVFKNSNLEFANSFNFQMDNQNTTVKKLQNTLSNVKEQDKIPLNVSEVKSESFDNKPDFVHGGKTIIPIRNNLPFSGQSEEIPSVFPNIKGPISSEEKSIETKQENVEKPSSMKNNSNPFLNLGRIENPFNPFSNSSLTKVNEKDLISSRDNVFNTNIFNPVSNIKNEASLNSFRNTKNDHNSSNSSTEIKTEYPVNTFKNTASDSNSNTFVGIKNESSVNTPSSSLSNSFAQTPFSVSTNPLNTTLNNPFANKNSLLQNYNNPSPVIPNCSNPFQNSNLNSSNQLLSVANPFSSSNNLPPATQSNTPGSFSPNLFQSSANQRENKFGFSQFQQNISNPFSGFNNLAPGIFKPSSDFNSNFSSVNIFQNPSSTSVEDQQGSIFNNDETGDIVRKRKAYRKK